jgi:ferredoxin
MRAAQRSPAYVRFDSGRCTGCAACLRVCPTRAIRIRRNKSIRLVEQCIGCGACLRNCPAGAVSAAVSGPEGIGEGHVAIALVSPVLYAQFPGAMPGGVLQALRRIGFQHTIDMSFFLEMFQCAAEEYIRRNRVDRTSPWPLVSPVCPVVVRLIAFKFPGLLPHVLPLMRPVALMAREVKERIVPAYLAGGREVVLYYINPCPTKAEPRREDRRPTPGFRETALGINTLFPALKREVETLLAGDAIPFTTAAYDFETCSSGNAALGAMSGGEIADMGIERCLAVPGLRETIAYLHKIERGQLREVEYIELRACREGCLGGDLTVVDKYLAKRHVQKMLAVYGTGKRLPRETVLRLYDKGRFRPDPEPRALAAIFGARRPALSLEELKRIELTLERIDGRDCGACGAPDCRTFAEDIVRGQARFEDCIWHHARRPRRKQSPPGGGHGEQGERQ